MTDPAHERFATPRSRHGSTTRGAAPVSTPPGANELMRAAAACTCGGGCSRCQAAALQRKAFISTPGDSLEREADAVADQVTGMAQPAREASSSAEGALDPDTALRAARQGGAPLSSDLRSYFEPRFGHDFSAVRVHADAEAAGAARAVQARAYTAGSDIVFGAGEYAPATAQGAHLLAHELTHVVQQGAKATDGSDVVARDVYSTADAELQAEEEIKNKKWNRAYGKDPAKQYGAERGSIDEDVTYTGKDKQQHTRHQPALGAASEATGPAGEKGTKMDMGKGLTDADVETVMTDAGYGDKDKAQIAKAAEGAGARITEAFQVMQIDTLEAQALFLAHAAIESRGLRSMTAQADPGVVGQFPGRGPLQITFQQQYVKALAYLDEQAKRLDAQGKANEAEKARAASAAVKADPAAAADPPYAFVFSAAMMHASGGVQASTEMKGKDADFGGTGPEDRWETGGDNFDKRIAHWTAEKAKGDAAADERIAYWKGVKAAGQRKTKAYGRAKAVLQKNVAQ